VGKLGLTAVSLAAAIPGGILTFLMLMALLNSLEKMPMMLKVTALLLLLIGAFMALFPAYLLIWYRGSRVVLARDKKKGAKASQALGDEAEAVEEPGLRDSFLEGFTPEGGTAFDEADELADEEFGMPATDLEDLPDDEFAEPGEFSDEDHLQTSEMDVGGNAAFDDFGEDTEQFSSPLSDDALPTAELDIFENEDEFDALSDDALPAEEFESDDDLLGGAPLDEDFEFEPFDDDDDEKA
jgi:hypothetical protein